MKGIAILMKKVSNYRKHPLTRDVSLLEYLFAGDPCYKSIPVGVSVNEYPL